MPPPLERELRREVLVDGLPHTVSLTADGVRIAAKGRRKGYAISWAELAHGDAELRRDLSISVDAYQEAEGPRTPRSRR